MSSDNETAVIPISDKVFRICTVCTISHIENCPDCFGFGLYVSEETGNMTPVLAAEAHGTRTLPKNLVPCPYCGSTEKGLPNGGVTKFVKYEYKSLLQPGEID